MTKIMCLADLHLTEKKPPCRPEGEDWLKTVERKLHWLFCTAANEDVDTIVLAGDIFDSPSKCSHEFMAVVLRWFYIFKHYDYKVIAIPGNHDLINNDNDRLHQTPFGVLLSTAFVKTPTDLGFGKMPYGEKRYDGDESIVVAHYGLWHKEKPYPGAPDTGNVEWFVNNCLPKTCKLFITGHYHVPFVTKVRGTVVVNCGCPFRMRADLINYKPTVTIANIANNGEVSVTVHDIPLDCEIRRDYIDEKKERETALDEMIGNIEGDFEIGFNFKDNFYNLSKECENKKEINKEFERCANGSYR